MLRCADPDSDFSSGSLLWFWQESNKKGKRLNFLLYNRNLGWIREKPIPDPGVEKAPVSGSGSATLVQYKLEIPEWYPARRGPPADWDCARAPAARNSPCAWPAFRVGKNPGLKKNQPSGFFWGFWGFWGFLGGFLGFLGFFGFFLNIYAQKRELRFFQSQEYF